MAKRPAPAIDAWFGPETALEGGALAFEGTLRLDGALRDAQVSGQSLVIGPTGSADGALDVGLLELYGAFSGAARVREGFLGGEGSRFEGDLTLVSPGFEIVPGARFSGTVRLDDGDDDD